MSERALVIGNSDGIGLAITRALLDRGWSVRGLSRSASPIGDERYAHTIVDVRSPDFPLALAGSLEGTPTRLVVYCAGIGEPFDAQHLENDVATFETNLLGLARAVEQALPHLLAQGSGTFVGLSSMADVVRSRTAPAYGASKAGVSRYLEGLGVALKDSGVHVVNVRLGFVDTKMAKADVKPWLLQPEDAASRILGRVMAKAPPLRLHIPRRMAVLTALVALVTRSF